jgi:hypothetical protein
MVGPERPPPLIPPHKGEGKNAFDPIRDYFALSGWHSWNHLRFSSGYSVPQDEGRFFGEVVPITQNAE